MTGRAERLGIKSRVNEHELELQKEIDDTKLYNQYIHVVGNN
jgi:hypothetical protein